VVVPEARVLERTSIRDDDDLILGRVESASSSQGQPKRFRGQICSIPQFYI
jgi:hypothetical protein